MYIVPVELIKTQYISLAMTWTKPIGRRMLGQELDHRHYNRNRVEIWNLVE